MSATVCQLKKKKKVLRAPSIWLAVTMWPLCALTPDGVVRCAQLARWAVQVAEAARRFPRWALGVQVCWGEWGWPWTRRGEALAHSPPQWRDPRGQLNSPGSTWWREKGTFQRLLSRKDLVVGDLFQDSLFVWRLSQQMSTQQTAWTRIWTRKPTEPWQYCDWALSL